MQALQQQQPSREAALKEAAEEKAVAVQRRAQAELDIKELRERLRTDSTARVRCWHACRSRHGDLARGRSCCDSRCSGQCVHHTML